MLVLSGLVYVLLLCSLKANDNPHMIYVATIIQFIKVSLNFYDFADTHLTMDFDERMFRYSAFTGQTVIIWVLINENFRELRGNFLISLVCMVYIFVSAMLGL